MRNLLSLIASVCGCGFCFIALMGANSFELSGTFIISLIILMFLRPENEYPLPTQRRSMATAKAH